MHSWDFQSPGLLAFGEGKAACIGSLVKSRISGKILLITGPVLLRTGAVEPVLRSLREAGVPFALHAETSGEPTSRHAEDALALFRRENCTALVACGGGGPMDLAKAVSLLHANGGSPADYARKGASPKAGPPVFALPTTAGSGSEVSGNTVIIDAATQEKLLIGSPALVPVAAVLDPLLTRGMPPALTAATGMDALTHAIESYVSRKATDMTMPLSLRAAARLARFLPLAWKRPDDAEARRECLLASLEAGLAFANSSVALVHGMARPLGAKFGIPHGLSNAMLLETVTAFSLSGNPRRYARLAQVMGAATAGLDDTAAAGLLPPLLRGLAAALGIPRLRERVGEAELAAQCGIMVREALASGSPANNPREAAPGDIARLYKEAL